MLDRYFEAITGRVKRNKPLEPYLGCDITTQLVTMLTGEPLNDRHLKDVTLCVNKKFCDEMDLIDNTFKTTPGKSSGLYTLPKEYFFPFNWTEKFTKNCITQNTRGIHWWKRGW